MVKPDGQRYLEDIEEIIKSRGFEIEGIYHIGDWEFVCSKVYARCIGQNTDIFKKEFLAHVWLNKYLFGNNALVLMLSKPGFENIDLLREVMQTKKFVRQKYNASKNGTFMVVMDINKIGLTSDEVEKSELFLKNRHGFERLDEMIAQEGMFRTFFLQYVHCPDAILDEAKNELEILENLGVFSDENLVSAEEWAMMKRYSSMKR